jgi:hypothetical protein
MNPQAKLTLTMTHHESPELEIVTRYFTYLHAVLPSVIIIIIIITCLHVPGKEEYTNFGGRGLIRVALVKEEEGYYHITHITKEMCTGKNYTENVSNL